MKKLMFVAAAALCATVPCKALESQNVVGYDQANLRGDNAAIGLGASFVNTDGTANTLANVTVTGYNAEEGYADGYIYAKKLNGYGVGGTSYYWFDYNDGEGTVLYGWYDDEGNDLGYNDVPLANGEALWIYSPSTSYKLQSAGQVPSEDIAVSLPSDNQAKLVANPMPTTLTLGQIDIIGYNPSEGYADGYIYAKKLNGYGVGGTSYYWFDYDDGEGTVLYGWYDDEGNDLGYNDVQLAPGETLWIYSPDSKFSITFPKPTL